MRYVYDPGDIVELTEYAYTNVHGGTAISNHLPTFTGPAKVKITKAWNDYETGRRYISNAVSPEFQAFLKENADPKDQRVFFGEFDVKAERKK